MGTDIDSRDNRWGRGAAFAKAPGLRRQESRQNDRPPVRDRRYQNGPAKRWDAAERRWCHAKASASGSVRVGWFRKMAQKNGPAKSAGNRRRQGGCSGVGGNPMSSVSTRRPTSTRQAFRRPVPSSLNSKRYWRRSRSPSLVQRKPSRRNATA
jgi:hypothetical protein